jgi:hypothetical protein
MSLPVNFDVVLQTKGNISFLKVVFSGSNGGSGQSADNQDYCVESEQEHEYFRRKKLEVKCVI